MTPRLLTRILRCLIWPAIFAAGLIALGAADRWAASLPGAPLAVKAVSFYLATLMLYAAFPHQRRGDLTVVALLWVVVLDLTVAFLGAPRAPGWVILDGAAVLCAYAPGRIEDLRWRVRKAPDKTFAEIAQSDRRKRRRRQPAQPAPTSAPVSAVVL